jgi:uncharacterized membrane protein
VSAGQTVGLACLAFLVAGMVLGQLIDRMPGAGPRPWWYRASMTVVGLILLLIALYELS